MENSIVLNENNQQAYELHNRILVNANMALTSWAEACKGLKEMRDTKLYVQLGFETFEDYTVKALNIKERQAYTYISTYENLGERFLQSNASLGITKLSLLTQLPAPDRQDIVDDNDIAGMTVEEVKKLVAENDSKGEQINLLENEIEEKAEERNDAVERADEAERKLIALQKELEAERTKPVEVAVQEPDAETLNKIRQEAEKAARAEAEKQFKAEKKELSEKLKAEKEKAVAEAAAKSEQNIADYKARLAEVDSEKAAAAAKAQELEKKLAVSSSPETVKFTFYFDTLQADYAKIFESITKIKQDNPEMAQKYTGAMEKYQSIVAEKLKGLCL